MKLRIKGNSIRLRLQKGELQILKNTSEISEKCVLNPSASLIYSLKSMNDESDFIVKMTNNEFIILCSEKLLLKWIEDDTQVGIYAHIENGTEEKLYIQVEKDFACLKPRAFEDESDAFPNPNQSMEC